jgi:hypothetical protein
MKKDMKTKWLENTENFIARLEKFNYIRVVDGNALISEEGYIVSHSFKMNTHMGDGDYPIQVVINIRKDGHHVQTWGCDSNEANGLYTNFFLSAKGRAYNFEHDAEKVQRELNEEEFWSL